MEKLYGSKIDLNEKLISEVSSGFEEPISPASITLNLGALAMKFAQVERVPRYDEKTRENDAEHSYMLALVANELSSALYPELNSGLIAQYAIVHDLIETVTGDVATFNLSAEQLEDKRATEHAALGALVESLPPYTAKLLCEYEDQQTKEARFVKAVDKLLPIVVDIMGSGQKVMREDYNVSTPDELMDSHTKLHKRIADSFEEFPPIVNAHELLCKLFEIEFEATTRLR